MKIPVNDLSAQIDPVKDRLRDIFNRVLDSGWFLGGPETDAFEKEFTTFTDTGFTVTCASGTEALVLAFKALGLSPGDEVVMPSHTAPPCYHAAVAAGCVPVFAEVDEFCCLAPEAVQAVIGPKTRAVLAVHLYGQPCDMEGLTRICREKKLFLIEDCAQAHGTRHMGEGVGSFGDLSAFSFYPTKNLGALGDGGAVCGKDSEYEARLRRLKQYGEAKRYESLEPGMNSRMDELQAAFLRERLSHLGKELVQREQLAAYYAECLENAPVELPSVRPGCLHGWHLFVIKADKRDKLKDFLAKRDIGAGVHYPVPGHLQPMFVTGGVPFKAGKLARTETLAKEVLSLPFYPGLSEDRIEAVCEAVNAFYGA